VSTHRVDLSGFANALGQLPPKLEKAIIRGMVSAAMRGVHVAVQNIATRNPQTGTPPAVDEGSLMRSVSWHRIPYGAMIVVDAPHASMLEYGTRPHAAPLQPLIDWAKRKFSVDDKEAKRIAYAVRGKIKKLGTKPRRYMARTVVELQTKIVPEEVERELLAMP
jgi:hypothetical protein